MINILKNNFERIKSKKSVLVIACILMPLLIGIAIFFSVRPATKELIAVSPNVDCLSISNEQYNFVNVDKSPALSELVQGRYVAYVEKNSDGTYSVETLKNEQDKTAISTLFETGKLPTDYKSDDVKRQERGVATNILGFVTMLMLMQGVALTTLYPEDRLKKTFYRIMCSSVSGARYLLAQFIFTFIALFVPTFIAICAFYVLLHINLGISLWIMGLLLMLLDLFATGFSLFICSILDRNTNLVATGISVVTCILAGCFIPFSVNNSIVSGLLNLIPQTKYMNIVHNIEFGTAIDFSNVAYILLFTFLLLVFGFMILQKRVQKGDY